MTGLMIDLGLKRSAPEHVANEAFLEISKKSIGCGSRTSPPRKADVDQRRALLGCYYLSSCVCVPSATSTVVADTPRPLQLSPGLMDFATPHI